MINQHKKPTKFIKYYRRTEKEKEAIKSQKSMTINEMPPIIDEETWAKANTLLKRN